MQRPCQERGHSRQVVHCRVCERSEDNTRKQTQKTYTRKENNRNRKTTVTCARKEDGIRPRASTHTNGPAAAAIDNSHLPAPAFNSVSTTAVSRPLIADVNGECLSNIMTVEKPCCETTRSMRSAPPPTPNQREPLLTAFSRHTATQLKSTVPLFDFTPLQRVHRSTLNE